MQFNTWLADQQAYQTKTFKISYPRMKTDVDVRTDYVTMNLNAAFLELGEAQQETPWKPWATAEDRTTKWAKNRDKFVGELVDVLFFVANALTAVECTDEELQAAYNHKIEVNQQRQAAGYDGSNKCSDCGRAFDDAGVILTGFAHGSPLCSECWKVEMA